MQTKYLCVLIHIWIKGEVGAVRLVKPSSKIFYWPFQGGSFVDLLCFSVLCLLCLYARLFICALWSPDLFGSRFWCITTVSLSLSHWYPGSGVVLACIDSWSLHRYLLWKQTWNRCRPSRVDRRHRLNPKFILLGVVYIVQCSGSNKMPVYLGSNLFSANFWQSITRMSLLQIYFEQMLLPTASIMFNTS